MKKTKFLCLLMVAALVLSLCSCSNPNGSNTGNNTSVLTFTGTAYTVLPSGTDGSAGPSWTYVHFGDWPQSEKATSVTVDETKSVMQGAYTYYLGSDNAWYAKKSTTYYKVEPIKWRVLTTNYNGTGKKILLTENILINYKYYDYNNVNRTIGVETIYPNNYEHSRIRAYLNGLSYQIKTSDSATQAADNTLENKGFLQTAFTVAEQNAIATTTVINNERSTNPDGDSNASLFNNGENQYASTTVTSDKIFLLSMQEVTKSDYGFASYDQRGVGNTRIRKATAFAKNSDTDSNHTSGDVGSWWLRSPFFIDGRCTDFVYYDGNSGYSGSVRFEDIGVVPALCLE